jgi:HEAT repeats
MPGHRRAGRMVAGIVMGAVVVAAVGIGIKCAYFGARRAGSGSGSGVAINEQCPLGVLTTEIRNGDNKALAFAQNRASARSEVPRQALTDQEAKEWLELLAGVRAGFPKFAAPSRTRAAALASRILDMFAVEPAPPTWIEALKPVHDLLSASLGDPDVGPRAAGMAEISKFWVWMPGRSLTPFEERALEEWKGALYRPVVRCLSARDEATRMVAVSCLGALPIDEAASVAIAYVDDQSASVRKQTLSSFSRRSQLLTDEMLLKRLHDGDAIIREMASLILKTRGLSQESIGLGGLMYSPKPEQRASVIPLLKNRTDLDPVVWLLQLSRDPNEMVRVSAIEALGAYKTPTVQRRLAEMARSDNSDRVREAAGKLAPPINETTASLPPLPGSPSLNPKAN